MRMTSNTKLILVILVPLVLWLLFGSGEIRATAFWAILTVLVIGGGLSLRDRSKISWLKHWWSVPILMIGIAAAALGIFLAWAALDR